MKAFYESHQNDRSAALSHTDLNHSPFRLGHLGTGSISGRDLRQKTRQSKAASTLLGGKAATQDIGIAHGSTCESRLLRIQFTRWTWAPDTPMEDFEMEFQVPGFSLTHFQPRSH